MKRRCIVLFSVFLSFSGNSQITNFRNISIEEVVLKFSQSYITNYEEDGYIKFEKRKEGYVIASSRFENGYLRPFKRQVFYSSLDTGYAELDFTENKGIKQPEVSEYLDDYLIRNFNIHILYNYPGWYKDVIDSLESQPELSDDQLYGLGRAYNQAFFDLILDQDDDPENQWSLGKNVNCLSNWQIAIIDSLSNKTLACYRKLMERNPAYETAVGPIALKFANEVMTHFHFMLTFANERSLSLKLPEHLYTEEVLLPLRNSLKSCPPGAILLSFGDNDFYPILYLQKHDKLRSDVYLINYNLISIDQYIFRATKKQFESSPIKISVDTALYTGKLNEYIRIKRDSGIVTFSNLLPILKESKWPESNAPVLKGNKFAFSTISGKKVFLLGDSYMLKNHWILINIIENLGARKLCLLANFADPLFKDLNRFFINKNNISVLK